MLKRLLTFIALSLIIDSTTMACDQCPYCDSDLDCDAVCGHKLCQNPPSEIYEDTFAATNLLPLASPEPDQKPTAEERNKEYNRITAAFYKEENSEVYSDAPWIRKPTAPPLSPLTPPPSLSDSSEFSYAEQVTIEDIISRIPQSGHHFFLEQISDKNSETAVNIMLKRMSEATAHSSQPMSKKEVVRELRRTAPFVQKIKDIMISYGEELTAPNSDGGEIARLNRITAAFLAFRNESPLVRVSTSVSDMRDTYKQDFIDFVKKKGDKHQLHEATCSLVAVVPVLMLSSLLDGQSGVIRLLTSYGILQLSLLPQWSGSDHIPDSVLVTLSIAGTYQIPRDKIYALLSDLLRIEPDIKDCHIAFNKP
ncbi:hypothetical protein N9V90_02315 [Endozoicomonas sp.]|nr:hypothetical protein [Endozoicomonas sp.]